MGLFCCRYLVSGDADDKCYIWDWKTTKLYKIWKADDDVCFGVLWHPHEPSKLVTAGWDGLIKYWVISVKKETSKSFSFVCL
jgi:pre-mRNA-processing factor 17